MKLNLKYAPLSSWYPNKKHLKLTKIKLKMAQEKYFDQLSCARSTQKLVKIHNTFDQLFTLCQKQNVFTQQIITFFNSYFTWYPKQIPSLNDTGCYLVGFNLRQACFNLQDTCVLMKECSVFNTSCTTCQVGKYSWMTSRKC